MVGDVAIRNDAQILDIDALLRADTVLAVETMFDESALRVDEI